MLMLLCTLIISYLKLDVGERQVSFGERWAVDIPFSVYLGWVSVATIANITNWLNFIGWDSFGISPQAWAVIMLAVASVLGAFMAFRKRDAGYLLVFVWAFAGIAIKQADTPFVANSAWAATIVALGLAVYSLVQRNKSPA
jgi:hypothetical protein